MVVFSAGNLIPADGIVLEAKDFFVNQAVLTVETFPAERRPGTVPAKASLGERANCVFTGTSVSSGTAQVLIVQTGRATVFGQVAGWMKNTIAWDKSNAFGRHARCPSSGVHQEDEKESAVMKVLSYEHRSQPILPRPLFIRRIFYHVLLALTVTALSLGIGVIGYRLLGGLSWIDALMNAAMILGGMGPVNEISSIAGKLFATFYALYAGVAFLAIAAVLVAPFAHRLLHRLHLDDTNGRN